MFAVLLKRSGRMSMSEPPPGRSQATHPSGMSILEPSRPPPAGAEGWLRLPGLLGCLGACLRLPLPGRACLSPGLPAALPAGGSSPGGGGSDVLMLLDSVSAAFRIEKPADALNAVSCNFPGQVRDGRLTGACTDRPTIPSKPPRQWPG